ncbi:hypothetical protein QO002_005795 [Pararhizobium capsulatum DSM 1112]|uniref:Uncharacterized protein n=1 Tax=Pararhizobium capsulatum DSM 1112 TaxID=1121113 RepID=A0ABU0C0Y5_9HYPH|nr:hypothetical protein [Pararhizobium capsulatum]MDQ0323589.1 hypothetical protein [Pararhizobium capsulatum DSM 1112]
MIKSLVLAGSAFLALSTTSLAQDLPMTCDTTNLANLEADVIKAPSDAQKSAAKAAIGTATVAMQAGNIDACVAAMQKARLAIDG